MYNNYYEDYNPNYYYGGGVNDYYLDESTNTYYLDESKHYDYEGNPMKTKEARGLHKLRRDIDFNVHRDQTRIIKNSPKEAYYSGKAYRRPDDVDALFGDGSERSKDMGAHRYSTQMSKGGPKEAKDAYERLRRRYTNLLDKERSGKVTKEDILRCRNLLLDFKGNLGHTDMNSAALSKADSGKYRTYVGQVEQRVREIAKRNGIEI